MQMKKLEENTVDVNFERRFIGIINSRYDILNIQRLKFKL